MAPKVSKGRSESPLVAPAGAKPLPAEKKSFYARTVSKKAANTMVCGPFAAMRDHLVAALRIGMAKKISQPGCHSPHSKPSSR